MRISTWRLEPLLASGCMAQLTKARSLELKAYINAGE